MGKYLSFYAEGVRAFSMAEPAAVVSAELRIDYMT